MRKLLLPFCAVCHAGLGAEDVWIISVQPFTGEGFDAGISMRYAANIMLEAVNNRSDLLPGYRLRLLWQDDWCWRTMTEYLITRNFLDRHYFKFPDDPLDIDADGVIETGDTASNVTTVDSSYVSSDPVAILGSACTASTMALATAAHYLGIPHISNAVRNTALSDRSKFPNFFRTIMPDTLATKTWLFVLKELGVNATAVITYPFFESMALAIAREAPTMGVQLLDTFDITDWPTLEGIRPAVREFIKLKLRTLIGIVHDFAIRMLLCTFDRERADSVVLFTFGWFSPSWWTVGDTPCGKASLTRLATSYIGAVQMQWRADDTVALTCGNGMTAGQFKEEFFRRQGREVGDYTFGNFGYRVFDEGAPTADAVCMYALLFHEMLVKRGRRLSELKDAYGEMLDLLAATDLQGVQGRIKYDAGSPDPSLNMEVYQMQTKHVDAGERVKFASYDGESFIPYGVRLQFPFPEEDHIYAGYVTGARPINGTLIPFRSCEYGETLDMRSNSCQPCPEEQIYLAVADACACAPGSVHVRGSSDLSCMGCPRGSAQNSAGQDTCDLCPPGYVAEGNSSKTCTPCPRGTYAEELGTSKCTPCNATFVTSLSGSSRMADCVCPLHTRFDEGTRRCEPCTTVGDVYIANCPGGHTLGSPDPDWTMTVAAGYMVWDGDIFECAEPSERCLGDRSPYPNATTPMCAAGFDGRACSACADGLALHGNKCAPCEGGSRSAVYKYIYKYLVGLAIATTATVLLFHASIREPDPVFCSRSIILAYVQSVAVILSLDVKLPRLAKSGEGIAKVALLDFDVLNIATECVSGASFEEKYVYKLAWPFLIAFGFLILFFGVNVAKRVIEKKAGHALASPVDLLPTIKIIQKFSPKMHNWLNAEIFPALRVSLSCFWPIELDDLINAAIKTQSGFFIVSTRLIVTLFSAKRQPTGVITLAEFPEVVFQSKTWRSVLPIGAIAFLFYTLGFVAFVIALVVLAPRQIPASSCFRRRCRCLWGAVDPRRWWYCIVQMLFGLVLNLIPVVSSDGYVQTLSTIALVLAYLLIVFIWTPWRWRLALASDAITKSGLFLYLIVSINFHNGSHGINDAAGFLNTSALFLPVVCCIVMVCIGFGNREVRVCRALSRNSKFWQQVQDLIRIAGSKSYLETLALVNSISDADTLWLDQALDCMQYQLLGLQPSRTSGWRCGLAPFEVLRPGQLEGELIARGVPGDDHRETMRKLRRSMDMALKNYDVDAETTSGIHKRLRPEASGADKRILDLFLSSRSDDQTRAGRELNKDMFMEVALNQLKVERVGVSVGDLQALFDEIDFDSSGVISHVELCQAIRGAQEPMLPSWYQHDGDHGWKAKCHKGPLQPKPRTIGRVQNKEYDEGSLLLEPRSTGRVERSSDRDACEAHDDESPPQLEHLRLVNLVQKPVPLAGRGGPRVLI